MTAEGIVYMVLHCGKDYYYLPTKETWVMDMKQISLGDIYFSNRLVQMQLGKPEKPDMKNFPGLSPNPYEKSIKISIK